MSKCFNCGAVGPVHDHHVVPRSLGGISTVPLCPECHGKAHGRERGFRDTGELVRKTMAHLRAEGVPLGGAALGWERLPVVDAAGRRCVVSDAAEADTVRRILVLREEGLSLRAIAESLTAEGRATKHGGRWFSNTVRRVIARGAA